MYPGAKLSSIRSISRRPCNSRWSGQSWGIPDLQGLAAGWCPWLSSRPFPSSACCSLTPFPPPLWAIAAKAAKRHGDILFPFVAVSGRSGGWLRQTICVSYHFGEHQHDLAELRVRAQKGTDPGFLSKATLFSEAATAST
jgi:hypothetical protein